MSAKRILNICVNGNAIAAGSNFGAILSRQLWDRTTTIMYLLCTGQFPICTLPALRSGLFTGLYRYLIGIT